jgi:hypothetical protein
MPAPSASSGQPWCGKPLQLRVGASSCREVANTMGRPSGIVGGRPHADGVTRIDLVCTSRSSKCSARRVGSGSARGARTCRMDGRVHTATIIHSDPPLLGQPQRPLGAQRAHGGQSLALAAGDPVEMGHHTLPEGGLAYRRRQRVSLFRRGPVAVKTGGPRPPAHLIPHPPHVLRIECPLGQRMGRAAKAVRAFGRVYGATPRYVRTVRGVYVRWPLGRSPDSPGSPFAGVCTVGPQRVVFRRV